MRRFGTSLLLSALGLSALGCSLGHRTVTGQVFIATQGGQSIKLGMVQVVLIPEGVVRKHLAAREEDFRKVLAAVRDSNARTETARAAASERASERARALRVALPREFSSTGPYVTEREVQAWIRRLEREWSEANDRFNAARYGPGAGGEGGEVEFIEREAKQRELSFARSLVFPMTREELSRRLNPNRRLPTAPPGPQPLPEPLLSNAFYFEGLHVGAVTNTQTDADGRFSLDVPRSGRFFLAATSERKLMGETETYFWLVRVRGNSKKSAPILLCNSNLLPEGAPLSVLFARP